MNEALLHWINQDWAQPWLDGLFGFVSDRRLFALPFALGLLAWCWRTAGRRGLQVWLLMLLVVGIGDALGNQLKHWAGQPRPCYAEPAQVRLPGQPAGTACGPNRTGWPSNHALNFFAMAAFLGWLSHRRAALVLFLVAGLVGLSRIYLGRHYPDQVAAGALIGLSWGMFCALLARRRGLRLTPRDVDTPSHDRTADHGR